MIDNLGSFNSFDAERFLKLIIRLILFFLFSLSQDASNQSTLGATIKILFVCVDVVVVVVVVFDIIVVVVVIDAVVVVGVVAVVVDDANFFV